MAVVTIPYGLKRIDVSVPDANYVETISPRSKQPIEDEVAAMETALDRPIGSARLEEIARPGDVVACMHYRQTRVVAKERARVLFVCWRIDPEEVEEAMRAAEGSR